MLSIFNIFLSIVVIKSHDKVMSQEYMHVIEVGYTITLGGWLLPFTSFTWCYGRWPCLVGDLCGSLCKTEDCSVSQ